MAATTTIIHLDSEIKAQAEALYEQLGLDIAIVFNMFLRQSIRERGIPFELRLEEPNALTIAALEDVEAGRNLHGPFDSVDALMADLMEDD